MLVEVGQPSDEDLVVRVQAGDEEAFAALARRYRAWLVRLCTGFLGDRHLAEDVAQDSLVKVYRLIAEGQAPARLRPWLRVVARHACVDEHRRRVPEPVEAVPDRADLHHDARFGGDHVDADDLEIPLATAWDRIDSRHREVLRQRELHGLTYAEIATGMGLSLAAVETLLFRARGALRREYARAGGEALTSESLARGLMLIDAGRLRETAPLARVFSHGAGQLAADVAPAIAQTAHTAGGLDGWRELAAGVAAAVLALGLVAPPKVDTAPPPSPVPQIQQVTVSDVGSSPDVDTPEAPAAPSTDVPDPGIDAPAAPEAGPSQTPEGAPSPDADEQEGRLRQVVSGVGVRSRTDPVVAPLVEAAEPGRVIDKILD